MQYDHIDISGPGDVSFVPTLRKYVPNSEKNGFYIQANVGAGAPVTLQVSNLAGKILQENRYSDGDSVPTKLVWAMYDVELLSTGNSGSPNHKRANVYNAFTGSGLSSHLSDATRKELVRYLDDYQGTQQRRVRKLRRSLKRSKSNRQLSSARKSSQPNPVSNFIDDLRRVWDRVLSLFNGSS